MTGLPVVPLAIIAAGVMDLIFALGFYLIVVRPYERRKSDSTVVPPPFRPNRLIVIILAAVGILTIVAGTLIWVLTPLLPD